MIAYRGGGRTCGGRGLNIFPQGENRQMAMGDFSNFPQPDITVRIKNLQVS